MIIQKTFPPNKFINEPYGTIHEVDDEDGKKLFIQVSQDVNNPHWIPMGDFLLKAFSTEILDKEFVDACIYRYETIIKAS